ncbi:hypothetical protein MKX03_012978, partial [Papaver bracteatum]
KLFRVLENWVQQDSCKEVIAKAWSQPQQGSAAFQTVSGIKLTKKEINKWNYEVFGNVKQHIKEIENKFQEAQSNQKLNNKSGIDNLQQELRF